MIRLVFLTIFISFFFGLKAQEQHRCSMTIQAHEQMMEENEAYRIRVIEWRKEVDKILKGKRALKNPSCSNGPIKIPVAIHFDSGLVPAAQESCVINVVVDQIAEMNNEIAGLDVDAPLINNFLSCFGSGILGDACIEFCIGQFNHPSGFGLVDGDYAVTFGQVSFSIPPGNYTPVNPVWSDYINIYVDNLPGGLLGVSNGIPGGFNGDGVMIDNCVFGTGALSCSGVQLTGSAGCYPTYDEGETLAHELGHYLGLFHIWGDNFHCSGQQDLIADTPDMATHYSGYLSCGSHTSCSNLPVTCSSEDMYMNFMSYAGDACMYMFSSDQSDVMNATAVIEGFTTVSSKCLVPPVADFLPDMAVELCNSDCIYFTDLSSNTPDSWDWVFLVLSGNLVLDLDSSTLQNPTVCVVSGDQGNLRISLTASNASGSDTDMKVIYVSYASDETFYADNDFDGFGDPNITVIDCEQPVGFVDNNLDCDDNDSNAFPGNIEICDGIDNNCNTLIDEACIIEDCDGEFLIINNLVQNTYRAEINLHSNALIDNGQSVLFTAGDDLDLNDGFEVMAGTQFEAKIENCTPINIVTKETDEDNRNNSVSIEKFESSVLSVADTSEDFMILIKDRNEELMSEGSVNRAGIRQYLQAQIKLMHAGEYLIVVKTTELVLTKSLIINP